MALIRRRALGLLQEKLILTDTHKMALFLCPRYKSMNTMTETDRTNLHNVIRDKHHTPDAFGNGGR